MSEENSILLNDDIRGPGRSVEVKTKPREAGSRINRNAKRFAIIGLVGASALILGGVVLSGHGNKSADGVDGGAMNEQVGLSKPPSPPAAVSNPFGGASAAGSPVAPVTPGATNAITAANPSAALNNPGVALANGGPQAPLSEKQKYRNWLVEQHYKSLEGNYLSAQSAQEAGLGEQNGLQQLAGAGQEAGTSGNDPLAAIRAAQAAATAGAQQQIDPGLLAQLQSKGQGQNQSPQEQNKAFLANQQKGEDGYLHAGVERALGRHELLAGSIIPATLITTIDSDLPGVVTAMVRQTVYDTLHPDLVVIPQGTKLVGQYSSEVAYGQSRALIAWNRLIFPNGSMIDLKGMLGTDGKGQSGFEDQVDNHYLRIFGSSILISLLGVAAQISQPQNAGAFNTPPAGAQAAGSLAQGLDSTGTELLRKNLGIQPTIKIRAGYLFNVMVSRTMILPVYPLN